MCKVLAFANQKGGVGKTTSTYNIGCAIAREKKKVLMIDLDPQASLTVSTGYSVDDFENTIDMVLKDEVGSLAECTYALADVSNNLFLVPSSVSLQSVEMLMTTKMGREKILSKAIDTIKERYDYILIDCPPQIGNLTINALSCADAVVVCCKTDFLSYQGINLITDSVNEIVSYGYINPNLHILGVIATFYEKIVRDNREVLELMEQECNVLGVIKKTSNVYKDILTGRPVVLNMPNSDVAQEYTSIAKKIMKGV